MTAPLVVIVHHTPAPQGSKRSVGGGRMVESSTHVGPFRDAVTAAAMQAIERADHHARPGPIAVDVVFTIKRPQGHFGTGRNATKVKATAPAYPATKPDLDKLARALLDGLDDAGVFLDDGQVADLHAVKSYPHGHLDALDTPGCVATVTWL